MKLSTIISATLGALVLAFSTVGVAAAEDASAQPEAVSAPAADQLPESQDVSDAVIDLAGWVIGAEDNQGYPFAIIDKEAAQILIFGADGRLRGAAPVLLGSAVGDHSAPGVAGLALRDIPGHNRTTPAGRFVAGYGPSVDAGRVLWVDYESAVSLHPTSLGVAEEHRAERLASPEPDDNRISHGCINVSPEFYEAYVQPAFRRGGVFYILPERQTLAETFPDFAESRGTQSAESSRTRSAQH